MLSEKNVCHEDLKRIADTLRISVDDFYVNSEYYKKHEQTDRMLSLWEKLSTSRMREDALDAIRGIARKK